MDFWTSAKGFLMAHSALPQKPKRTESWNFIKITSSEFYAGVATEFLSKSGVSQPAQASSTLTPERRSRDEIRPHRGEAQPLSSRQKA